MAAVAASLVSTQMARAAAFTWDGGATPADTNWSNGTNWVGDVAPAASADTIIFNDTGLTAGSLTNTVDAALPTKTFTSLAYNQNDETKTYTTQVGPGLTLATTGAAGLIVMPSLQSTPTLASVANVAITGNRLVVQKQVTVSGRPTIETNAAAGALESRAILDLTGLTEFAYIRGLPPGPGIAETNFQVGRGTGNTTADKGPYSGKVLLSDDSHIKTNRVVVGSNSDGNPGVNRISPVSELILGQSTNINTGTTLDQDGNVIDMGLAGNFMVGYDSTARAASGAVRFRAGLTNPVLNLGNLNLSIDFGDINRNGFEVGSNRSQGNATNGGRAFGVMDTTSASGGSDGAFNGFLAGMTIGRGSTNAHGATGMFSMDKGAIDSSGTMFLGRTTNALNSQLILGVFNLGVKGTGTDAGAGSYVTTGNMNVGSREQISTGVNMGIFTLAGTATAQAERVLVGINTVADAVGSSSVGIVNLNGGVLTTAQVKGGTDTETGSQFTRLVNFNGGTLKAKTGTTFPNAFMGNLTTANVYAGGATLDSNGENVTITQPLVAPAGSGLDPVIAITNGGSGYRSAPIVNITGGGGVGATAVAQISAAGVVTGLTVTNPGTGYTSAPTIELIANAGTTYAQTLLPYGGTPATVAGTISANTAGDLTKVGVGTVTLTPAVTTDSAIKDLDNVGVSAGTLKTTGITANSMNTVSVNTGGGAMLDVNNGGYIIKTDTVANVRGLLLAGSGGAGFGAQTWNQPGINSSFSATDPLTYSVGYMDNDNFILGPKSDFDGVTVPGGSILVKSTLAGDADLDWDVDDDDVTVLGIFYGGPGHWYEADFDYTGIVDDDDVTIMGITYGQSLPGAAAGVAAVPEPASVLGIGLLGVGALARRNRRGR